MPYTLNYNLAKPLVGGDIDRWGNEWNDNADKIETSLTGINGRVVTLETNMTTVLGQYLSKTGGTMTGFLTLADRPLVDLHAATKKYVDDASTTLSNSISNVSSASLQKTGGTMTGAIVLPGNPTSALQAAPKQYIDAYMPAGVILPYAGTTTPSGWLSCDGSAVSRTTYAGLFAAIGTTWGAGNGSTTFNLPDFRGYFLRGAGTNSDGAVGPAVGGKQADTYLNHSHGVTDPSHSHSYSAPAGGLGGSVGSGFTATTGSTTGPQTTGITVDTSTTGGTETRPKNQGVLYIIRT